MLVVVRGISSQRQTSSDQVGYLHPLLMSATPLLFYPNFMEFLVPGSRPLENGQKLVHMPYAIPLQYVRITQSPSQRRPAAVVSAVRRADRHPSAPHLYFMVLPHFVPLDTPSNMPPKRRAKRTNASTKPKASAPPKSPKVAGRPKRDARPPQRLGGSTPVSTPKAVNTTKSVSTPKAGNSTKSRSGRHADAVKSVRSADRAGRAQARQLVIAAQSATAGGKVNRLDSSTTKANVPASTQANKKKKKRGSPTDSDGLPSKRIKSGSNSRGQALEDLARSQGMGYNDGANTMPRLRVHRVSGQVVARMLVCSIQSIDYIVCQDCGSVFRWHSTGKHRCPGGKKSTINYDDIIPELMDAQGKEELA